MNLIVSFWEITEIDIYGRGGGIVLERVENSVLQDVVEEYAVKKYGLVLYRGSGYHREHNRFVNVKAVTKTFEVTSHEELERILPLYRRRHDYQEKIEDLDDEIKGDDE